MLRIFIIVTWVCTAFPETAEAQAGAEASPSDVVAARRAFEAATGAFASQAYRRALDEFERAQSLAPDPALWFNIARCHEELGHPAEAVAYFRRYLRDHVDAPDHEAVSSRVERLLAEARLEARPLPGRGDLVLHVTDVGGGPFHLDGGEVDASSQLRELPVGRHRIESASGFVAEADVFPGGLTRAYVTPILEGPNAQAPRTPSRRAVWLLAGASLLSFAVAATLAVKAERGAANAPAAVGDYRDVSLGLGAAFTTATLIALAVEPVWESDSW